MFPRHQQPAENPQFAYYAYGRDYHEVVRERLDMLARFIKENHGGETRVCVDTSQSYGSSSKAECFGGDCIATYRWLRRGHSWGNHTMNHLQGFKVASRNYLRNIKEADNLIDSNLYRPPHGIMRWSQAKVIKDHFNGMSSYIIAHGKECGLYVVVIEHVEHPRRD